MHIAQSGSGRDYAPELCGFYGLIPGTRSYDEVRSRRAAEREAVRRMWNADLVGSAMAVRMPFGFEVRAEEIPPWLAFLGTVLIAGACFALFCVL